MILNPDQLAEVAAARAETSPTRRATVPALDAILHEPLPVLGEGFVRVVDYMGDDPAIVQAARVSYGKGTKHVRGDKGLIDYLMRHKHTSPFEMCEIKLHVKLPIFVARQWIRHRTASVNEVSARYSVLEDGVYRPDPADLAAQAATNRQGRGEPLDPATAEAVLARLDGGAARAEADYRWLLGEGEGGVGLSREIARMTLPLSTWTQWYWKTDLHNLLHFVRLRGDPHAQLEIRAYAERLLEVVRLWVPLASAAFEAHRMESVELSRDAFSVLRRMLAGEAVTEASSGLGGREWRELMAQLGRDGG
ncbi:MAG: FAD-dependent thymidylate synthase [Geminicoccaceae bacterium]|nr:FAD-dependent thymidylate synthase [Geminicoccaceae bacterium]